MTTTINTPLQFWNALRNEAGLELKMKKGTPGRDADFEAALVAILTKNSPPPAVPTVEAVLTDDSASAAPRITIESLIEATLRTQRGFAAMMDDILRTLQMANAANARHALTVAFSFDRASPPLKLKLEEFREQVERIRTTLTTQLSMPDQDLRWGLLDVVRPLAGIHHGKRGPFPPITLPALPSASGDQSVDEVLLALTEVITDFCERLIGFGYGANRHQIYHGVSNHFPAAHTNTDLHEDARQTAGDATDGWDVNIVDAIRTIAHSVRSGSIAPANVTTTLKPWLSKMPSRSRLIQQKYNELLDVLKLPAWKKRHELYSVWVGTALLRSAKKCAEHFEFHPVAGELSFAFGGSRLATYCHGGEQFDIWAEFRSELKGTSSKRKKGIQPDFRIIKAALDGSNNSKTRFVLECKHYLKPSLSNFTQAADDYSRTCENADVFIVNHGPADHTLLSAQLTADQQARVQFLGNMTAGAKTQELEDAISKKLFPHPTTVVSAPEESSPIEMAEMNASRPAASIRLAWDQSLEDMDLSVVAMDAEGNVHATIDYSAMGDLYATPFIRLDRDVRIGPGAEQIDIARWHYARYDVVATKYSGVGEMHRGHLQCTVVLGIDYRIIEFPSTGDPHFPWHVATISVTDGVPSLLCSDRDISRTS